MNAKDLEEIATGIVVTVKQALSPRDRRLDALEARLSELDRAALKAGGTWARGENYATNTTVTFDGSLWRCIESHTSGSTFSHEHFVLVVKRGRDGR